MSNSKRIPSIFCAAVCLAVVCIGGCGSDSDSSESTEPGASTPDQATNVDHLGSALHHHDPAVLLGEARFAPPAAHPVLETVADPARLCLLGQGSRERSDDQEDEEPANGAHVAECTGQSGQPKDHVGSQAAQELRLQGDAPLLRFAHGLEEPVLVRGQAPTQR